MARATRPRVLAKLVNKLWPDTKAEKGGSEFMVPCPFCGSDKSKCAINPDKGVFQCWVCGERGPTSKILYHLKSLGSIKQRDIDAVIIGKGEAPKLSDLKPVVEPTSTPPDQFWTPQRPCVFPGGVFPLYDREFLRVTPRKSGKTLAARLTLEALTYLERRGLSSRDIRAYRLHFCYKLGSPYHGHIFIPCLGKFGREMTFWTTRSILPNPETKSFHSGSKYSRFSAKTIAMNEHLVVSTHVALCEGPFDAWSIIKHTGIPAIPLLGKNFHRYQKSLLVARGVDTVYICLDADAASAAVKLGAGVLKFATPRHVYLPDGDPNDVPSDVLKAAFENATSSPQEKLLDRVRGVFF